MSGTPTSLFAGFCLVLSSHLALAAGPAEDYIDAQLKVVRSLEHKTNLLADAADEAAARLLQGGSIYLSGERGMVLELLGRAGGLAPPRNWISADRCRDWPATSCCGAIMAGHGSPLRGSTRWPAAAPW